MDINAACRDMVYRNTLKIIVSFRVVIISDYSDRCRRIVIIGRNLHGVKVETQLIGTRFLCSPVVVLRLIGLDVKSGLVVYRKLRIVDFRTEMSQS